MKFEDVYGRWQQRRLSQAEAAEILGMSEGSFRRWRDRFEDEGAAGLLDRRLGKPSARQAPGDQAQAVLRLYRERYHGFTAKHFHDKLRQHHNFTLGYTWTKLRLQGAGLVAQGRAPLGAPQEAAAPAAGGHAAAPGRLEPSLAAGAGAGARPDRHPGRCPPARSTRPSWSTRKAP